MVNSLVVMSPGTRWVASGLVSAATHVISMKAQRAKEIACASSTK